MPVNNGRNGKAAMWAALSATLVALLGNGTVYLDGRTARDDVRHELRGFERAQCGRDELRDAVVIQALRDAQRRARASIGDPVKRERAVGAIGRSIDQLGVFGRQCRASLD